jgi:cell wall-associated NlpC family hydrolase
MRRKWLVNAVIAATALSVPLTTVAGVAQASTIGGGQQKAAPQKPVKHKPKSHKSHKPPKKAHKHYVGKHRRPETFDQVAAGVAKNLVGDPYAYGGTSPAGFDCSGLTQYVYRHTGHGKRIRRTAEDQFLQFKPVEHRHAHPGDLVFFHETSDPNSYVYHVGIYEGGDKMVAATTYGEGVQLQSFTWAGDTVTFGTITH